MDFFSSQTIQFMHVHISERHAAIRSICTQLPFVLGSNNTCCSIVAVLGVDGTFMASQSILLEMELFFI